MWLKTWLQFGLVSKCFMILRPVLWIVHVNINLQYHFSPSWCMLLHAAPSWFMFLPMLHLHSVCFFKLHLHAVCLSMLHVHCVCFFHAVLSWCMILYTAPSWCMFYNFSWFWCLNYRVTSSKVHSLVKIALYNSESGIISDAIMFVSIFVVVYLLTIL